MTGHAYVLGGDARRLPLPDASVDLICTSPPYFALRSYTDGGQHYEGQIGSEATPAEYIAALVDCTREWVRVLKPAGSIFVNLGDKYSTGTSGDRNNGFNERWGRPTGKLAQERSQHRSGPVGGFPPKCQLNLPERYRIACTDELGLIQRAKIIWSKPNGLPESVTDRVRCSHEDWVHLTVLPRYYAAVDTIREPHAEPDGRPGYGRQRPPAPGGNRGLHVGRMDHAAHRDMGQSPLGKLPGSVWTVPTEPLQVPAELGVDHFAAFPSEWPRRIILGWSPSGVCCVCGEGRRPVVDKERDTYHGAGKWRSGQQQRADGAAVVGWAMDEKWSTHARITGEVCACPEPTAATRPAVVLDPFGGTGTVALVARALGRVGVSVDMSADYGRLAAWRTQDPAQLAKVLGVPKPPAEATGQLDLLGGVR